MNQVLVVSSLALLITVGVYGLVAGIVKLDDAGLYLLRKSVSGSFNSIQRFFGRLLLRIAPLLMKSLAIVGTIAMFLVGGGILVHSIPAIHHVVNDIVEWLASTAGQIFQTVGPILIEGIIGVIAGGVVLILVSLLSKLRK